MTGYYLMHRGWMGNPVIDMEPFDRRSAWVWLIENANWKDGSINFRGEAIKVARGQIFTSYRHLASLWKWSDAKVRRFCVAAASAKMLVCVTVAGQTLITICNYDTYQPSEDFGVAAVTHRRLTVDAQQNEGKEGEEKNTLLRKGAKAPSNQVDLLPAEKAPEAILFREGRRIFGNAGGAIVTDLRKHFQDDEKVMDALHMAERKDNPKQWIFAILKKPKDEVTLIRRPIPKTEGAKVWGYMVKGKPCNPAFAEIPSHQLDLDDPAQKREAFVRANDVSLL